MLMSVSSPSSTISSRGKSTVRQFRRWAAGAGKINLAQRQRAVDETGEKVADVVIHDNPRRSQTEETVTSKTDVLKRLLPDGGALRLIGLRERTPGPISVSVIGQHIGY